MDIEEIKKQLQPIVGDEWPMRAMCEGLLWIIEQMQGGQVDRKQPGLEFPGAEWMNSGRTTEGDLTLWPAGEPLPPCTCRHDVECPRVA